MAPVAAAPTLSETDGVLSFAVELSFLNNGNVC
jgi:hypothetical protein